MNRKSFIVESLIEWLRTHLDEPLNINEIAVKSGFSKWYLQRMFFLIKKKSIGQCLRDLRLEKAAYKLLNSDAEISYIGATCGYNTQQSFTRAFSKKYSLSPGKFRKKIKAVSIDFIIF